MQLQSGRNASCLGEVQISKGTLERRNPIDTSAFVEVCMRPLYGEPHTWKSLATRRRESGYALSKNISREGPLTPQISPLRCAPVEMTKGRAALPLSVVAEQDPFFIAMGGPKAHDSSGRDDKGEGGGGPQRRLLEKKTADLSTALRSGRDDKGEGGGGRGGGCGRET